MLPFHVIQYCQNAVLKRPEIGKDARASLVLDQRSSSAWLVIDYNQLAAKQKPKCCMENTLF